MLDRSTVPSQLATLQIVATLILTCVEEPQLWRAHFPQRTIGIQQKPEQHVAQHLEQLVARRRRTAARTLVQQATRRKPVRRQSIALAPRRLVPQVLVATLILTCVEEPQLWRAHFPQRTIGIQQKPEQHVAQHLEQLAAL